MILHHHPLCPNSRFVRLGLAEMGLEPELAEERVWERRRGFLDLNPANETPVLTEAQAPSVPGAWVIAEYLDETRGLALGERRLLPEDPLARVEVRRLVAWFTGKMAEEVTGPLVMERVMKRFIPVEAGGGAPDMASLRAAKTNLRYHLRYLGYLAGSRRWLAGDAMGYADLAAAAQVSCIDYLGEVPWGEQGWDEDEAARDWYARMKSRPSFRPLLTDRVPGVLPPGHYADLDF